MNSYLSIDIGGTDIKYGLLDHSGQMLFHSSIPTPTDSIDSLKQALDKIISPQADRFSGIGVSVPGKVDDNGTVSYGGNLPYLDHFNIKKFLEDTYHTTAAIINDGKSAALAEYWLGNLKGVENGAAIVLGTGVGSGILLNGKLLKGTHFQAGEISYMTTRYSGPILQELVSNNSSAVQMVKDINMQMGYHDIKDGIAAMNFVHAGNMEAIQLFDQYCFNVAMLINNMQTVIDVQRYVIGGGISNDPLVVQQINEEMDLLRKQIAPIGNTLSRPEIMDAKFKKDANLYGGLYNLLLTLDPYNEKHFE